MVIHGKKERRLCRRVTAGQVAGGLADREREKGRKRKYARANRGVAKGEVAGTLLRIKVVFAPDN